MLLTNTALPKKGKTLFNSSLGIKWSISLDKEFSLKLSFMVPNMGLTYVLSYLGKTSLYLRTRPRQTVRGNLP